MNEFDFIETYLAPLAGPEGLGLKDDAAVYRPPQGHDLVITKDTMVEGVHFPSGDYGARTAQKLLRVNLSDLAAKAAKPAGYLLSLAIPDTVPQNDLADFAKGLAAAQAQFGLGLFGGDTVSTSGPMVVTATLIGTVPTGNVIRRDGAKAGDDIWVTGTIGDAFLGLQCVRGHINSPKEAVAHWTKAYYEPEPQLRLRDTLLAFATACADVSDGLIADCKHIAKASRVKCVINTDMVPLSDYTREFVSAGPHGQSLLTTGDDYELVFTAQPKYEKGLLDAAKKVGINITKIGTVETGERLNVLDSSGDEVSFETGGYQHF